LERTSLPAASPTIDLKVPATGSSLPQKLLLVEPSRTQSTIIRKYLQSQGFLHVTVVATGEAALQVVQRERPDAVLSAQHLSDMTGVQLAEQIYRTFKPGAPGFVLISSEAESAGAGSLSKCGKAVLLKKPFTPEQLADALKVVAPASSPPPANSSFGKLRVLIVDDSAPARLHIRGVLTRLGLSQFVEAIDGAHAVAGVASRKFDLIVTDYNMPHMSGRDLVSYLKKDPSTAAIPIIMVTTEDDPGKLEAVRRLGVAAICDKSFPPEIVQKVLEQLVKAP
jgi:two-component system chemotaxis response regulator CheY